MKKKSEFEAFDALFERALSVSHGEIKKREKQWKEEKEKRKRAKTSPASRAASGRA